VETINGTAGTAVSVNCMFSYIVISKCPSFITMYRPQTTRWYPWCGRACLRGAEDFWL